MTSNDRPFIERRTTFTWETKQELYEYFWVNYNLGKERVNREIDRAMTTFHLRKWQMIRPQELWQKVGNSLEQSCTAA
jgi:hypothetical protein